MRHFVTIVCVIGLACSSTDTESAVNDADIDTGWETLDAGVDSDASVIVINSHDACH